MKPSEHSEAMFNRWWDAQFSSETQWSPIDRRLARLSFIAGYIAGYEQAKGGELVVFEKCVTEPVVASAVSLASPR